MRGLLSESGVENASRKVLKAWMPAELLVVASDFQKETYHVLRDQRPGQRSEIVEVVFQSGFLQW